MMIAAHDAVTGFDLTKALVISASEENPAALSEALAADGFVPVPCVSMTEARKFIPSDDIAMVFCDDCLHDFDRVIEPKLMLQFEVTGQLAWRIRRLIGGVHV
jgi:hypothetical protein